METDLSKVSILTRRKIEALIAVPLIRAFMEKYGKDAAGDIVSSVINHLAREYGADLAKKMGGNSIKDLIEGAKLFSKENAVIINQLDATETKYDYDVTKCRYAEMYQELGMAELGYTLSCGRDMDFYKGFNPKMRLKRTKTIMEGYDCCDFRITIK